MAELESLYTAAEMKEAEAGHDVEHLMQRAGGAVADAVARDYPGARVVAVCGRGANGGDGRIAAEKLGGLVVAPGQNLQETDVIVDALFGTGFHGEPREEAARSIAAINEVGVPVVAVDIPSGVDASTGEIGGAAVEAELTVTFHGRKVGLVVGPGRFHTGRVELVDIGLEPAGTEHRLVTRELLRRVPRKRPEDNKYSAGSVLVVGGAPGTTGAACLAAGDRDAPARGGEATARGRLRGGRARRRARARPRPRPLGRPSRARPAPAGRDGPTRGRRRGCAL